MRVELLGFGNESGKWNKDCGCCISDFKLWVRLVCASGIVEVIGDSLIACV